MSNPVWIVRNFCTAWDRLDFDAISDALHPDVLYRNIPLDPIQGKAPVMRYLRDAGPFETCSWELVNIAADGNTVLTERVDRFVKDGKPIALQVMGVFVVDGSLIRVWRDYFDLAGYRRQF